MKQIRVGDVITTDKVETWGNGDIITITAPTGAGKSYFIKNRLKYIADKNNKKILLLTNRNLLKDQFIAELSEMDKKGIVTILNYQAVEDKILHKKDMGELNKYDYIVADEAHYFFADSTFNNTTDLSLEWILNQSDKIRIFMSATADFVTRYITKYKNIKTIDYVIENDYSYIKNLYFYENDKTLMNMLLNLPKDEKIIYFSVAKKAYEVSREFEDSAFYCSKYNANGLAKHRDLDVYEQIKSKYKFDKRLLCTTTVMDNGVSIKDDKVKHIVVDVFDPDTIVQCIGRKRIINPNDKVNIYIKNCNKRVISGKKLGTLNKMKYAKILRNEGQDALLEKYPRTNYGNLIYSVPNKTDGFNYAVNEIAYFKCLDTIIFCNMLLTKDDEDSYIKYIAKRFKFNTKSIISLEKLYFSYDLNSRLSSLVGVKLFKEQQEKIINIIDLRDSKNRQQKSYKQIKAYIEENTPYTIVKGRDKRRKTDNGEDNPNRDRYFWEIVKTEIV